ncbi:hypothetical protein ABEH87_15010 [Erwinia sp. Eh17-17]|jgi:hypothetical protein|uniref:hypothetical protein n=1 Tax=Erwinia sp. Eh17-17 TaxID=3080330 RepID=UPI00320AFFB9
MARRSHTIREIEAVLRHAERLGWRVVCGGSHAWGKIYCPWNNVQCRCGEFCISCVWSTPKNPHNHARQLRRVVEHCTMRQQFERNGGRETPWNIPLH